MSTWYTVTDETAVDRLLGAWPEAPVENIEVLGMMLDVARDQVLAYAPAPGPDEGAIVPGALTVSRRNAFPNPRMVQESGWGVGNGELSWITTMPGAIPTAIRLTDTSASLTSNLRRRLALDPSSEYELRMTALTTGGGTFNAYFRPISPTDSTGQAVTTFSQLPVVGALTEVVGRFTTGPTPWSAAGGIAIQVGSGSPLGATLDLTAVAVSKVAGPYFDGSTPDLATPGGRTYDYAWEGAENASASVETYRPDVFVPSYPTRYVLAQLRQAQSLFDAGRVSSGGDIGDGGFVFTPRPMDKTIKAIIRPLDGKPHAL